jgi:carbamoylphosphate synthase small subunit
VKGSLKPEEGEKRANPVFEDGSAVKGKCFHTLNEVSREASFKADLAGFSEAETNPSCKGWILMQTHPATGNYVSPIYLESSEPEIEGYAIKELFRVHGHPASELTPYKRLEESVLHRAEREGMVMSPEMIRGECVILEASSVYEATYELEFKSDERINLKNTSINAKDETRKGFKHERVHETWLQCYPEASLLYGEASLLFGRFFHWLTSESRGSIHA